MTNERAVLIPLFCAERDWSKAMFLKKQITENGEKFARNKYSCRKKLKKAFGHAQHFYNIAHEIYDKQTCIEAEAYLANMKAHLDLEYNRFEEAFDSLLKVKIIYKNLAKSKDSLEAAIYEEKIAQVEPLLRLCSYNIQNRTGQDMSSLDVLENEYNKRESLDEKVANSIVGTRKVNLENITTITYQGKAIPLKTPKLKSWFLKLETQLLEGEKVKNNADLTLKERIEGYTNLLHIIEECIVIIQKEKTEETKKSEASGTLYNLLLGYVGSIKSLSILERCLLKAFAYAENIPLAQVFTKQKLRASHRPQLVIKLFDKAIKALKNLSQERGVLDPVKIAEFNMREMVIQVYLKFYIAVFYAGKKYDAAYCILKRAKDEAVRCLEYHKDSDNEELIKLKAFSENQLEYMLCKTKAMLMLEYKADFDNMNEEFIKMNVNDAAQPSDNYLNIVDWLFDNQGNLKNLSTSKRELKFEFTDSNLNVLETGGKNVLAVDESADDPIKELLHKKVRLNKKAKLIDLYPKMKPVVPKPFFFDLAADAIEYPNIGKTIKELQDKSAQGGGIFSKLKFWGS